MQWRNQDPILLAIERFKPEETKPILQGVKKMTLATPPVKRKAGASILFTLSSWTLVILDLSTLANLDFRYFQTLGK